LAACSVVPLPESLRRKRQKDVSNLIIEPIDPPQGDL